MWIDFINPFNEGRTVIDSNRVYSISVGRYFYHSKGDKEYFSIIAKSEDKVADKPTSYHLGVFKTLERANNAFGKLAESLKNGEIYCRMVDDWGVEDGNSYQKRV